MINLKKYNIFKIFNLSKEELAEFNYKTQKKIEKIYNHRIKNCNNDDIKKKQLLKKFKDILLNEKLREEYIYSINKKEGKNQFYYPLNTPSKNVKSSEEIYKNIKNLEKEISQTLDHKKKYEKEKERNKMLLEHRRMLTEESKRSLKDEDPYKFQKYINSDDIKHNKKNNDIDDETYSTNYSINIKEMEKLTGQKFDNNYSSVDDVKEKISKMKKFLKKKNNPYYSNKFDEKYTNDDHKKSNVAIDDNIKKEIENKINKNKKIIKKMSQEEREKYFFEMNKEENFNPWNPTMFDNKGDLIIK